MKWLLTLLGLCAIFLAITSSDNVIWNTYFPIAVIVIIVGLLVWSGTGSNSEERKVEMPEKKRSPVLAIVFVVFILFLCFTGFLTFQSLPMAGLIVTENQAQQDMQEYSQAQAEENTGTGGAVSEQALVEILDNTYKHDEAMAREISRVAMSGDISQTTISVFGQGAVVIVAIVLGIGGMLGLFVLLSKTSK